MAELTVSDGLLGFALSGSQVCGTGRTLSVWRDDAAMMSFVLSEAHTAAMTQTNDVSVWAGTTSWLAAAGDPAVSWELAVAKLKTVEGY